MLAWLRHHRGVVPYLFLLPGGRLGFDAPAAGGERYDEYISDPAKPVT